METSLQRIVRKTGRRPTECTCPQCRTQCRTPCLGTPDDILRIILAGYKDRLAPTMWGVGMVLGRLPYPVPMVQARGIDGYCTFFRDGLCELHDLGLKPTEGRLSHHTITQENLEFSRSLTWNVAREWLDKRNISVTKEIVRLMSE